MTEDKVDLEEKVETPVVENINQENEETQSKQEEVVTNNNENVEENLQKEVEEKENVNQETGKNVELASNILENAENIMNSNLPMDTKPYIEMAKEKLLVFGKAVIGVFEKIGDFVENLFKKKY